MDLITNSMLKIAVLLYFAIDSAPYFTDEKTGVPHGKLQDHLLVEIIIIGLSFI